MTKETHALSIFGGDTTKGTGISTEWDISLIDKSEHFCDPERDRRIIYTVKRNTGTSEARIRERYNGSRLEVLIFVWSGFNAVGIPVIEEVVPIDKLDTVKKRKAYLKRVAKVTETLASKMATLDLAISNGTEKIHYF
jgi:hypothetical protein